MTFTMPAGDEGYQDHEERPPRGGVVQALAYSNHHGHERPDECRQIDESSDHRYEDEYVQKPRGLREPQCIERAVPSPPRSPESSVLSIR